MKYAKSIKLNGELIDAIHGAHEDCKLLNMVCDYCGESVIYRQPHSRTYASGVVNVAPSWVHRSYTSLINQSECELRVNGESENQIKERRNETRNQRYQILIQYLFAMHYNFNDVHYFFEKQQGFSYQEQLDYAKYFWRHCSPAYHSAAVKVQTYSRSIADECGESLKTVLQEVLSRPVEAFDGFENLDNSKVVQNQYYGNLQKTIKPDFHLMLCSEVLNYILKPSQLEIFKILFGTFACMATPQQISIIDSHNLACALVRRICLTDWLSAYGWASKKVSQSSSGKGFSTQILSTKISNKNSLKKVKKMKEGFSMIFVEDKY